ncbi:hypothetical protein BKA70DRAFT_1240989 [Coprinopsis sp. MPI-PUGE-AT-0042]|nr:hypothetical protein BKA70DRAFT_1240989 [Coprinopsis sp. MPI-PUGE-AT-0042]
MEGELVVTACSHCALSDAECQTQGFPRFPRLMDASASSMRYKHASTHLLRLTTGGQVKAFATFKANLEAKGHLAPGTVGQVSTMVSTSRDASLFHLSTMGILLRGMLVSILPEYSADPALRPVHG